MINSELGGRKVKGKKDKNKNKARQRMKRDNRIVGGFEVKERFIHCHAPYLNTDAFKTLSR